MKLKEKIAQMLILGFDGTEVDDSSEIVNQINEYSLGGVILFDFNLITQQANKNILTPQQVKKLNSTLQNYNHIANDIHARPQIPLLISVDYEGGKVNRLKPEYGFPETHTPASLEKLSDLEIETIATQMAFTLQQSGFNVNYAPLIDVNVHAKNPIIAQLDRSFSNDPERVAHIAAIFAHVFNQHHIYYVLKHFPGHGSSEADSHLGFVEVSHLWTELELIPYQRLFKGGFHEDLIMTAHIINRQLDESGLPATLSKKILTGILREQLGFQGVIVSDDMQMRAISEHYGLDQAVTWAINAGIDMFIFGNQWSHKYQDAKTFVNLVEKKIKAGEISIARIEEAFQRILKLKQRWLNFDSKQNNF